VEVKPPDYRRALATACREYERLARERGALDRRLAQLHETIGALTRLCGFVPTVPWGLTEACRVLLQRGGRPMTALEVRDRLRAIGFDLSRYANDLAAIHTVLKRLRESGQARALKGAPGTSYQWTSDEVPVPSLPWVPPAHTSPAHAGKPKRSTE
jgi:hypothetical protein